MKEIIIIKVVEFFLENPFREVYLRQLAKELKLSPYATKKYVDLLARENLIISQKKANLRYLRANNSSLFFKHLKIALNIKKLLDSRLIGFLKDKISNLSSIVLFGSLAKGDDTEESDIDIVIIGASKRLNLVQFEETLGKEINTHVFSWSEWKRKMKEDSPFYYEVTIYGIPLYGELPIIK